MRIGYTAGSLEIALKKSIKAIGIDCEWPKEGLTCPIPGIYPPDDVEICGGNPVSCKRAGLRTCRRKIRVSSRPSAASCATLRLRYTVSDTDHNGFIEEGDSALQLLFARGYISKNSLEPCVIQNP